MTWTRDSVSARRARLPRDWPQRRAAVLYRDGGLCQIDGPRCTGKATAVDHIEAGDDHRPSNLRAVCDTCHGEKTAQEGATASAQARRRTAALRYRPTRPHPGRRVHRKEDEIESEEAPF